MAYTSLGKPLWPPNHLTTIHALQTSLHAIISLKKSIGQYQLQSNGQMAVLFEGELRAKAIIILWHICRLSYRWWCRWVRIDCLDKCSTNLWQHRRGLVWGLSKWHIWECGPSLLQGRAICSRDLNSRRHVYLRCNAFWSLVLTSQPESMTFKQRWNRFCM